MEIILGLHGMQRKDPERYFWLHVKKTRNCWLWKGRTNPNTGSGLMRVNGKQVTAHYVSWLFGVGHPSSNIYHTCGNQLCVRPSHLQCGGVSMNRTDKEFWSMVDKKSPNECWEWTKGRLKSITSFDYGTVKYRGKSWLAHRLAWVLANKKPVPKGMHVCHSCDNPPCCNPKHLFVGTDLDNSRDMMAKGRGRFLRGEDMSISKLTEKDVLKIRKMANGKILPRQERVKIAEQFGLKSAESVLNILLRKTWKHV